MQPIKNGNEKFSLLRFTLSVGTIVIFYFLTLMLVCPNTLARQFQNGIWAIIFVSLGFHLFNGNFEYFFHRYILHSKFFRWLKKFYKDHTVHHAYTNIFRGQPEIEGGELAKIVSHYEMVDEKQYESSFFPYWGLAGFTLVFSTFIVPLQLLLPTWPILLGSFMAITFSYCLYELLHALEHTPYPMFWEKLVESPRFGFMGKKIYGFHMFHHANVMCNMGISGFFGLPVFDWLFKTYKQPEKLLRDGTLAQEQDFSAPRPCWLIRWIDGIVFKN